MLREMALVVIAVCASGSAMAQGKSGSSHGGGPPSSTPAASQAPASPPASSSAAGSAGASPVPASTGSSGGTSVTSPPASGGTTGGSSGASVSTLPALPPLPTGAGGVPTLNSSGTGADCADKSRRNAGASDAGKCQ